MTTKRSRLTLFLSGLALLIFLLVLIITAIARQLQRTATLEILVTPASATITINNQVYRNGTVQLEPGNYAAVISKDNFVPQTITLDLQPHTTTKLYAYLEQSDGSYSWYLDHPDDSLLLDRIGDYLTQQEAAAYIAAWPILADLPIDHIEYPAGTDRYIEYHVTGGRFPDCQRDFCLKITDVTGGNRQAALQAIQNLGYNPNDYQILYEYTPITPLD